ncbi:MAG: LL-diaminopimelate aminotransferase [Clostridia bacterium]|nr:LL-diaminopimelate aminotransferase [Clostridia bacterium]
MKVNREYLNLKKSYLFSEIAKRVSEFEEKHPEAKIIRLGIGDVTLPLVPEVIDSMHRAVDDMSKKETFKGYPPEHGQDFLVEKIEKFDYKDRGLDISKDEIFVSDGAKSDTGNILDIFDKDNIVAVCDPIYPVYVDTNIMAGRDGQIIYLETSQENGFSPNLPNRKVDIIYLCSPNNPTGTTMDRNTLKKFVDYANEYDSILLFDSAYEAFITDDNLPKSIYEIPGAKNCAIEFRSFSKTAGFTGVRCGYTVVPKDLKRDSISLNELWARRQATKFNGVSYVTQRAAEAVYSEKGRKQVEENINYYLNNAKTIAKGLESIGIKYYGAENSPYIWFKVPEKFDSWSFFDYLLENANIVGTPGVGFGKMGEGYFRLTGFSDADSTKEAVDRIKKLSF